MTAEYELAMTYPAVPVLTHVTRGTLPDTASRFGRTWECEPLPAGTVRLPDGTPAAARVALEHQCSPGPKAKRHRTEYLVSVDGYTPAEGLISRWAKADGTVHQLATDGFETRCDCESCTYGTRQRGAAAGEIVAGCTKAELLPELFVRGLLPDPRANPDADTAAPAGERAEWEPCDPPYYCGCGQCGC